MKQIANPPNPFLSAHREWLEPAPIAQLQVFEDSSRQIISHNESPDIAFRWSVNPYRGCFHGCIYCYARRSHEYLDMGAGTDFESKLVVKLEAAALLKTEFLKKSWKGELIVFSGVTDCYQPLEAVYRLTEQCLQVCMDFKNPVSIITKSYLVTRDIELLAKLHKLAFCTVVISIPFLSDDMARKVEPQASPIKRRFEALEVLAKAGIPVGISLAPTLPGLNDTDIPHIMKKAKDCGAQFAFHSLVRLSGNVKDVFVERLKASFLPERVQKVLNRIRETRDGSLNNADFGSRMKGVGTYWKSISDLFEKNQKKLKLDQFPEPPKPSCFRVPNAQLDLGF